MPANEPAISQFFIQVDGDDLPHEAMDHLRDAVIEDDLGQPAMLTLRFHDPQLALTDGEQFRLGRELSLGAADAQGRRKLILVGEVTAIESELDQRGPMLIVRGYDRSHRLHRGRKTRTFLRQSDSDIAQSVAREAGLRAETEPSGERHDYVIQDGQTDMEFLRARAARIGFRVVVQGKTLRFEPADQAPAQAPAQEYGLTLRAFRARLSAAVQPNELHLRSWDAKAKRAIVGKAQQPARPSRIGEARHGGELARSAFGAATVTVTDRPVRSQGEADQLAQALLDELAGDYLTAEGLCQGEPSIRAGCSVEVKGVGRRLAGSYFVSASRHEYTPDGGYVTTFQANGRRASGLLASLDASARPSARRTVDGVVVGIVTNINDPDGLGRVKVKFPWLDERHESDWARLAAPGAGPGRGVYFSPEVDDEVLVAFEHGDISRPFVVGGLWNGKDKTPAEAATGGKVQRRTLKTRVGHTIELHDDEGAGKGLIRITTAGGHTLTLSDNDKQITVKSSAHTITLDDQGRAVKIESGGDLELKAPGGKLSIGSSGVELASNASLKVQANAMLDVKTSAVLTIQGSLVKIN
jgi:uncharacterized protein involved in type VI secretion and phage assembly